MRNISLFALCAITLSLAFSCGSMDSAAGPNAPALTTSRHCGLIQITCLRGITLMR
jgi:hypothetical protein